MAGLKMEPVLAPNVVLINRTAPKVPALAERLPSFATDERPRWVRRCSEEVNRRLFCFRHRTANMNLSIS